MHHPFMKALGAGPGSGALEDHAAVVLGAAQIAGMNKLPTQLPSVGPGNNVVRPSVEEAHNEHQTYSTDFASKPLKCWN